MKRLPFLSHLVICCAVACAFAFAWQRGVPQAVFASDKSMMTSAIGGLLVLAMFVLGKQAWNEGDAHFGHLAERLAVMFGLFGTALGLSLQAKSLAGGATSFEALATSLYTTAAGVSCAAIIAAMTYSLERTRRDP